MPIAQEEPKRPHFGEAGNEASDAPTTCCATNPVMRDASGRATDPPNAYVAWLEAGSGRAEGTAQTHATIHPIPSPDGAPPHRPRCCIPSVPLLHFHPAALANSHARPPFRAPSTSPYSVTNSWSDREGSVRREARQTDGRGNSLLFTAHLKTTALPTLSPRLHLIAIKHKKSQDLYRLTAAGKFAREGA